MRAALRALSPDSTSSTERTLRVPLEYPFAIAGSLHVAGDTESDLRVQGNPCDRSEFRSTGNRSSHHEAGRHDKAIHHALSVDHHTIHATAQAKKALRVLADCDQLLTREAKSAVHSSLWAYELRAAGVEPVVVSVFRRAL
jgi:hypothetical protein